MSLEQQSDQPIPYLLRQGSWPYSWDGIPAACHTIAALCSVNPQGVDCASALRTGCRHAGIAKLMSFVPGQPLSLTSISLFLELVLPMVSTWPQLFKLFAKNQVQITGYAK